MASNVPITLRESNDEVIDLVLTSSLATDNLTLVTKITVVLKPDQCTADTDATVTTLTSTSPTQVVITAQTATQINATVYIPASALATPYDRWWRVDTYVGTAKRTAIYGHVTLIDL